MKVFSCKIGIAATFLTSIIGCTSGGTPASGVGVLHHCSTTGPANSEEIRILFDTNGCPTLADPEILDTDMSKQVHWQAYSDLAGGGVCADKKYDIYFDPFKGSPIKAPSKGRTNPQNFDSGIPVGVEYKYTVVGENCTTGVALDPHIKIN